jgi:4-hydroxybenzoate polyprenyltransferase
MLWRKIHIYNRLIVLAHSVFALPFALWGYVLGSTEVGFSWEKLFWVLVAVVSARTSAMAFNRYVDREWDARNPRTQKSRNPQGPCAPQRSFSNQPPLRFAFL